MKRHILISSLGDDYEHLETIIESIKESLNKENRLILFCPSSTEYYEGQMEWEQGFIKELEKYGIYFDDYVSLKAEEDSFYWQQKVKEASLIYLHGGNPLIQKQLYEDKGIYHLLKDFEGLLLGASAGAMNMSSFITLTPTNEEYQEMVIEKALGLSQYSIYPHLQIEEVIYRYMMTGDGLVDVLDLIELSKKTPLMLLADGQFIVDDKFIGSPKYYIEDGIIYRDGQEVFCGYEELEEQSLHQYQQQDYQMVNYYESIEDGLIQSMFNIKLGSQNIYHSKAKFFATTEEVILVAQINTETEKYFMIQHPHLKKGILSYQVLSDGIVREVFKFKTIFSKKVETMVILDKIREHKD